MRKRSYASLKRQLDKVFSEFIRRRLASAAGIAVCVTCGSRKNWKEMQCGHFIPRHYLAGRWHILNCAVQCPSCNVWGRGRYPEFAAWGVNTYGQSWLTDMVALKRQPVKLKSHDLENMIEDFEKKLADMLPT